MLQLCYRLNLLTIDLLIKTWFYPIVCKFTTLIFYPLKCEALALALYCLALALALTLLALLTSLHYHRTDLYRQVFTNCVTAQQLHLQVQ